jgi:hypothetical protein
MPIIGMTQAQIDAATAKVVAAGGKSVGANIDNRLPGETRQEANTRITEAYKAQPKPELTQEGKAAGAQIKFVRTEAGGVGTFKEIFPIGTPIPTERSTAYGNTYDAQGNLISGTGLKPGVSGTASTTTRTPEQQAAYDNAKALAQSFVDEYGGSIGDYFNAATGKVTQPSAAVISKKFSTPTGKTEISRVDNGDGTFTVTYSDKTTAIIGTKTTTPARPIGTPPAFVYDPISKTYKMPTKPTEAGNWTWDNIAGWTNTLVNPGATGMETGSERTLAQDTFKNTLALFFGAKEMSQPWANALFKVVSSYYKSGSTIDESLNLALQDARNKPELEPFTKRFAGVFALQDRLAQGEAIDVPTIAEFFKSESTLGDKLREVGLADLATQEILGEVLGTGKSVAAVLNLVNDVFMTIDNAPDALKKDLQVVAPGIDRTSIAKALLLGKKGADALQKQIKEVSVLSAAKSQGITIENTLAADIAARGFDYGTSLTNFGTVAKGAVPLQKLTEISTGKALKPEETQGSLIKSIFQQNVQEQERIRLEAEKEAARFSGTSGTFGSRSLASRNRANRVI